MNAYDKQSAEILADSVAILGNTERARLLIQAAYNLGRTDGKIESTREALNTVQRINDTVAA